jgi:hypothetical protein
MVRRHFIPSRKACQFWFFRRTPVEGSSSQLVGNVWQWTDIALYLKRSCALSVQANPGVHLLRTGGSSLRAHHNGDTLGSLEKKLIGRQPECLLGHSSIQTTEKWGRPAGKAS